MNVASFAQTFTKRTTKRTTKRSIFTMENTSNANESEYSSDTTKYKFKNLRVNISNNELSKFVNSEAYKALQGKT